MNAQNELKEANTSVWYAAALTLVDVRDRILERCACGRDQQATNENREAFRSAVAAECQQARFDRTLTDEALWEKVWTINRFPNTRSSFVTENDIPALRAIQDFGDPSRLAGAEWGIERSGRTFQATGRLSRAFVRKTIPGDYPTTKTGRPGYSNSLLRLHWIRRSAIYFKQLQDSAGGCGVFAYATRGYDASAPQTVWEAYAVLRSLMAGPITALHLMTVLGFPVVKPDIWLVRMWSWMGILGDNLPSKQFERSCMQSETLRRRIVDAAQRIAAPYCKHAWHPESAVREIDLVTVKLVQGPERSFGIERADGREQARDYVKERMRIHGAQGASMDTRHRS